MTDTINSPAVFRRNRPAPVVTELPTPKLQLLAERFFDWVAEQRRLFDLWIARRTADRYRRYLKELPGPVQDARDLAEKTYHDSLRNIAYNQNALTLEFQHKYDLAVRRIVELER